MPRRAVALEWRGERRGRYAGLDQALANAVDQLGRQIEPVEPGQNAGRLKAWIGENHRPVAVDQVVSPDHWCCRQRDGRPEFALTDPQRLRRIDRVVVAALPERIEEDSAGWLRLTSSRQAMDPPLGDYAPPGGPLPSRQRR